jgi:hypothetical protein
MADNTFEAPNPIPAKRVYEVIICGIEGGHYSSIGVVDTATWEPAWRAADQDTPDAFSEVEVYDHDGGDDPAGQPIFLTDEAIQQGLKVLNEKTPHHVQDIINENHDVITGDALLQCIVLGEIVYG